MNFGFAPGRKVHSTRGARAPLVAFLHLIPWTMVAVVLGLRLAAPAHTGAYALYPLLGGVVFLGLPHGALDHLVPARLGLAWGRKPFWLGLYLFAYLALVALYFGMWLWAPRLAFAGFLLLTVWHWGQGDGRFMEIFLGRLRPTRWGAWMTVLVRGALPIVLPVLAFPETAESLFRYAASGLGLEQTPLELSSIGLITPLLIGLALALTAYAVNAVRAAPSVAVLGIDLLELLLLTALFSLVPAYLAVGVYFAFWHSLRHLARLLILDEKNAQRLAEGEIVGPAGRLTLELLPITLVALALLGSLYVFNATRVATLEGFIALYLVLISALTVPHAVVVAMMDVWTPELP